MNKELMHNPNFIRCSVIVAELLVKYKKKAEKESKDSKESEKDSDIHIFYHLCLHFLILHCIIENEDVYY